MEPHSVESKSRADARPVVGYIVSAWPRLSETFILNEVIAVERQGLDLRIFSLKEPGSDPVHARVALVHAPVTYLSLRPHWKTALSANLRVLGMRPGGYLRTLLQAVRYLRWVFVRRFFQAAYLADILRREPVIHLHAHFANAPAVVAMFTHRLLKIPYTFTGHAKDIYVKTPPNILRAEVQGAQAMVTCTEYNRRYLTNRLDSIDSGKVHCIYHGLDVSRFDFQPRRALLSGPPVILSVARLVEKKGLHDLIAAADILRQRGRSFQLEIIGDGPLRGTLEARVKELGLEDRVKFTGSQPHEMVCRAYQQASIFALPCVVAPDGDRDGIPNVLLEAMASGVPVVSTPVSGIPELIESEHEGLLVQANSPAQFADALDRLLTDPELADRLAQAAGAKVAARFSLDLNTARLVTLLRKSGADENSLPLH